MELGSETISGLPRGNQDPPPTRPSECHRVTVKYVLVSIAAGLESIGSLRFSRDLEVLMMVY